jgi:hypothetical protein
MGKLIVHAFKKESGKRGRIKESGGPEESGREFNFQNQPEVHIPSFPIFNPEF